MTQFAGLILAEKIDIPCDLKLTLFAGGGDQDKEWAPHLGVVPIPLLAGVRTSPRPPPPLSPTLSTALASASRHQCCYRHPQP